MKIAILAPFSDKLSTMYGFTYGMEQCGYQYVPIETKRVNTRTSEYVAHVAKQSKGCDTVLIAKGVTIPLNIYQQIVSLCGDTTFLTFDSVSGDGCGPPKRPDELGPRGKMCTRILLTGTEGARWFRENGYQGRIAQVYQGCRHTIWKPGLEPRTHQDRIVFLGAHYSGDGDRMSKFKAIVNAGYNFQHVKKCFHEAASALYWNSAICPNFVCGDITSNRVMRILASGGFCLTERNADINYSFVDGAQLAMFDRDNIPNMLSKIAYYMRKPEARERVAAEGYLWAKQRGWPQQVEKMVRFIKGEDVPADGAAAPYTNKWKADAA